MEWRGWQEEEQERSANQAGAPPAPPAPPAFATYLQVVPNTSTLAKCKLYPQPDLEAAGPIAPPPINPEGEGLNPALF